MELVERIALDLLQQGWSYNPAVIAPAELLPMQAAFEQEFLPAKVGKGSNHKRVVSVRGDWTHWLDPQSPLPEFQSVTNLLHLLLETINRKHFLGLKQFEYHLAKYPVGAFYKKHLDRHSKDSSRIITFILYLHQAWSPDDGGELVLYDRLDNELQTILPLPGSMVCFVSDEFPHEVKTSKRERRSLTGWMHSKLIY
jgi:SM-20-related protein